MRSCWKTYIINWENNFKINKFKKNKNLRVEKIKDLFIKKDDKNLFNNFLIDLENIALLSCAKFNNSLNSLLFIT